MVPANKYSGNLVNQVDPGVPTLRVLGPFFQLLIGLFSTYTLLPSAFSPDIYFYYT